MSALSGEIAGLDGPAERICRSYRAKLLPWTALLHGSVTPQYRGKLLLWTAQPSKITALDNHAERICQPYRICRPHRADLSALPSETAALGGPAERICRPYRVKLLLWTANVGLGGGSVGPTERNCYSGRPC